jgi:protein TonB
MATLQSVLLPAVVFVSAAAHLAAYGVLREPAPPARAPDLVELAILEPRAPAPTPPAPEPAEVAAEVAATPTPTVARRPRSTPPPAVGDPPPPSAAAASPADFTGTTLTNDGPGAGWASATGNGAPMSEPIGTPGAPRGPRRRVGNGAVASPANPSAAGPTVVRVADLGKRPHAPDLNAKLERNYPSTARQRGLGGKAVVRARIEPNGRARVVRVVSESAPQFGAACRRTLDGSRWDPPRDRQGRPVSTELDYTCRFEVGS